MSIGTVSACNVLLAVAQRCDFVLVHSAGYFIGQGLPKDFHDEGTRFIE